jgi:HSP20 family molecular chaperone IbpA
MNLAGQPTSRPAHAAGIISITTLMLLYSQSWPNRVSPLVMGGRMGRLLAVGK